MCCCHIKVNRSNSLQFPLNPQKKVRDKLSYIHMACTAREEALNKYTESSVTQKKSRRSSVNSGLSNLSSSISHTHTQIYELKMYFLASLEWM